MKECRKEKNETLFTYDYTENFGGLFNTEKDIVKSRQLFVQASTVHSDTKLKDFKIRHPIYA